MPLRDTQRATPAAWCRRCRGEIYQREAEADGTYCPDCKGEDTQAKNRRKRERNMTLKELSVAYRDQAEVLRARITLLQEGQGKVTVDWERVCLDERIKMLETMWREARDLAVLTERYYDWGYRRNENYTV